MKKKHKKNNKSKLRSSVWLKLKSLFLFGCSLTSQSNIISMRTIIIIIIILGSKGQCIIPGQGEHFDANKRLQCARRLFEANVWESGLAPSAAGWLHWPGNRADSKTLRLGLLSVRPSPWSWLLQPRPSPPGEEQLCLTEEASAGSSHRLVICPLSAVPPPGKVRA